MFVFGNELRSLRWRPSVLLTLANTLLRWSSSINLKSNMTPRCFWEKLREILLLKTKGGWVNLLVLRRKIYSWAGLLGSGLKPIFHIFHWKAHSLTFSSHHLALLQKCLHREQLKIMMYHQHKVLYWRSNYLINHLYMILEELQHEHWSMTNFDH